MEFSFVLIKPAKVLTLLLALAVIGMAGTGCIAPSSGGGCGGPGAQGWSGFASYDGILYFGSMDGEVVAVDPSARSLGLAFPSEREWAFAVKAGGAPGTLCGPVGCAPASRKVALYSTPVVTDQLVCVATYVDDGGIVMGINRLAPGYTEGVPLWSKGEWVYPGGTKSIGAIVGSLVLVEDIIYFGSSDGKVYALDAVYGEKKWEFDTGGKIWTSLAVKDGIIYAGNYDGRLHALSRQDGRPLWEIELPAALASSPVASEGNVFFGAFDHYLYAVDGDNGKERWKFEGGNWFWADPVVKDNVVYAACLDDTIYALDARSGRELRRFVADSAIVSTPVIVDDLLVAVSESGEVYVLELDSLALQRQVSIGYSVMAPLSAEDGTVYVHARDHSVYCVDVQKGVVAWKFSSVAD